MRRIAPCMLRSVAAIMIVVAASPTSASVIIASATIQEAVDTAQPGDIIVVRPGIYHETVRIEKDNITIVGPRGAVIDATGFTNGIHVGADGWVMGPDGFPACPPVAVKNFTLLGLSIRNADENGVFLSGVDGYQINGGKYLDNGEYAIFPNCSNNGEIHSNMTKGGKDTCIYVGDDVGVSITANTATACTVGIQIVSSSDIIVRKNHVAANTAGILAIVDPGNPLAATSNVLIENNIVVNNNLPNQAEEPDLQNLPSGTGILNVGGDDFRITHNVVSGNRTFGLAIIQNPLAEFDPRIDPNPDGNQVRRNVLANNGKQPTGQFPAVDIFYDGSGADNCFANNVFKTSLPSNVEASFPCQ